MAYAAIMVSVEPGPAANGRIALAQSLADRFDAALIGIAAEAPVATVLHADGMSGQAALVDDACRRVQGNLADAERRFWAALPPRARNKVEWRGFVEHPGRAVAREARSADLLVLGAGGTLDAGDVLMTAGRPVLIAPAGVAALQSRQVVIGWRDTTQSRRAVADAMPLLRRAEGVMVLAVTEPDDEAGRDAGAATAAVVAFLARHGVSAEAELRSRNSRSVAEELMRAAEERRADLIVSGAYGHARALEWAFGGVTRELLTHSTVCCLLSH